MSGQDRVGPLAGTRVIDLTRFPPGAYCTLVLADLGADVVRIDPPASAGRRPGGASPIGLMRGKRSMALDVRIPEANDILRRLAATSDVLVENAQPGAMEARGFGYSHAAVEFPQLIWCSISGFGQDGPYAGRSGHDITYLAHSGLLAALTPDLPWHPQAMLSVPLGALMAAIGVLGALVERGRNGKGCQIDLSIADAAMWVLSGEDGQLTDHPLRIGVSPGRRLYQCGDGEYISVAAAEPRTWTALCNALDLPDLLDDPDPQGDAGIPATKRLAAVFATKAASEWVEMLGPLGTAVGAVNRGEQIPVDPHNQGRGSTVTVAGVPVPANPVRLRDASGPRSSTATGEPADPGANTDEVLSEAGFSSDEIADLRARGVVA